MKLVVGLGNPGKELAGKMPIFGEVLGLQVIALAFGGKTARFLIGYPPL